MGELMCFHQCPQTIACLSFSQNLKIYIEKNSGKEKKQRPWTLDPSLPMSSPWNSFFGLDQLVFPLKWCHVDKVTIWFVLVLDPHLKALRPIQNSWPIRMFNFIGPCSLDPFLKRLFLDSPNFLQNFYMKGSIPMCAKVKFSQVGKCFSKTEKKMIFRDFFAIFRNKNVKLATSRRSHFESHHLWQNFCKNATADLGQLPFHAN